MNSTAACVRLNSPRSSNVVKLKAMEYNLFLKYYKILVDMSAKIDAQLTLRNRKRGTGFNSCS